MKNENPAGQAKRIKRKPPSQKDTAPATPLPVGDPPKTTPCPAHQKAAQSETEMLVFMMILTIATSFVVEYVFMD